MNQQETPTRIPVKFEIKRIRHHNDDNGFTVAEVKFTDYQSDYLPTSQHIIVGHFLSIFEDDEFEGEGTWSVHEIFGYRFEMEWTRRIVPQSLKGIKEFLKRFVKGIGKTTAERIVEHFGESTLTKIEEDWKNLLQVKGMGKKRAIHIHEKVQKNKRFEEIAMFILNHGGGYRTALRVYEAFGESSIIRVRENPFLLCSIKKISFPTADKFAKNLNFPHNSKERIKEGILYLLDFSSRSRGDLYISSREIKSVLQNFLMKQGSYREDKHIITSQEIQEALMELKEQDKVIIELNDAGEECVYLQNFNFIENRIVTLLKKLLEESKTSLCPTSQIDDFIEKYERDKGFRFAEKQKEAIYMALQKGISILTGGPGTGKTQTINSIIECVKSVKTDPSIHLSAPTGKASKRMTELTGMEAQTIHRLIGLNGFEDANDILEVEGDFLIVDESSMVDAYVFYKLLSSIQGDTRILFVGDYEQLPSVGAGLILRDLINSGKIPTTKLTEIFRQAQDSQIVMNAHKIINGITTKDKNGITFDQSKEDFYFISKHDRMKAQQAIIDSVKRFLEPKYGYTLDDIQILSPMRKGDLGVWMMNKLMQDTFNPRNLSKRELRVSEAFLLREGDKVLQTANNYDLDVFNGEIGKVTSIFEDDEGDMCVEVTYDDKVVVYEELFVEELTHAFCLTIHKSQGSEYPVVIMPIHPSQENMLNKNLIYTGVTRAKQKVVLIGNKEALDKAVKRDDQTVRNSLIQEKIKKQIQNVA